MKEYVKPEIVVEELIIFETAHSDPQKSSDHYQLDGTGEEGLGHWGCWQNPPGNWNN